MKSAFFEDFKIFHKYIQSFFKTFFFLLSKVKHGEAAYPRDAWVEGQYAMENGVETANNLPSRITGNHSNEEMPYNDPQFMSAQAGKENKGFDFELNIACNKKADKKW